MEHIAVCFHPIPVQTSSQENWRKEHPKITNLFKQIKAVNWKENTNIPIFWKSVQFAQMTKWRLNIRGFLERIFAELLHAGAYKRGCRCTLCRMLSVFQIWVLASVLKFPRTKEANHSKKISQNFFCDWLLLSRRANWTSASRPSAIIPSSAFLHIASFSALYSLLYFLES